VYVWWSDAAGAAVTAAGQQQFFVPGVPVPKGSAKAFVNRHTGKVQVMQDNRDKQKPWASLIGLCASEQGIEPMAGAACLQVCFYMPRPKWHYGAGRNAGKLRATAPRCHTKKPDLDKLVRCVKDALTGVAWHDDSQVVEVTAMKLYAQERIGAHIIIKEVKA
jgi:Holliday junction resolvase RusA-like endonuclease